MRNIIYILFFSILSLNAQEVDSTNVDQSVIKNTSELSFSKDTISENSVVTNPKNNKSSELSKTSNKDGFWGIAIAIMVGLIPIMLQIWHSLKEYKNSQIDKYGSFLYEKQFPVYFLFFEKIEELNSKVQVVFIRLNNAHFNDMDKEFGTNPKVDFINVLEEFRCLIKNNSLIFPNDFLTNCIEFLQLNNIVRNTISREIVGDEKVTNKSLLNIDEVGGLKKFSEKYFEQFSNLNWFMKNKLGIEYFSKQSEKYKDKEKNNFAYWVDRQARIE